MIDPDKTQKIMCIRRRKSREQILAEERARMEFFLQQAQISKQRLLELEVAA